MKPAAIALLIIALCVCAMPVFNAEAARGEPGSLQFGFGGCIYLEGQYRSDALNMAQNIGLDWLQIDVSWSQIWPDPSLPANWDQLDETMDFFKDKSISLMLSITDAPAWVVGANGPDANIFNAFLGQLTLRYPQLFQAIEILPRANTLAGWGNQPNPGAYMQLLISAKSALQQSNPEILVVAGGLIPTQTNTLTGEINDLDFLQGLYDAGLRDNISVISLNFSNLTGNPAQSPSDEEPRILRHYEDVRRVMLANHHESGILWINHLRLPDSYSSASASEWITQAYAQLRSQLYMGVAFYDSLNPPDPAKLPANQNSLILTNGEYHTHYQIFQNMILQNSNGSLRNPPGRPKSEPLTKAGK